MFVNLANERYINTVPVRNLELFVNKNENLFYSNFYCLDIFLLLDQTVSCHTVWVKFDSIISFLVQGWDV